MPKAKDSPKEAPVLARCALKPGTAGEDQCDKAGDSYAIRGAHPVLFFACLKRCTMKAWVGALAHVAMTLELAPKIHLRTGQLMR